MFKAIRSELGSVVIALVLGCLPLQMMVCESISAQTTSDSKKVEADQLLEKGIKLYKSRYWRCNTSDGSIDIRTTI